MSIKEFWSSKFIFNSYKYHKVIALAVVLWIYGGMKLQAQTTDENAPEVKSEVESTSEAPEKKEVPQPVANKIYEEKNQELLEVVSQEVPINKIIEITQPFINSVPITPELGRKAK